MPASDSQDDVSEPVAQPSSGSGSPELPTRPHWRRRILLAWTWVVIWAGVIWTLGGDDFSASATGGPLLRLVRWLFEDLDAATRLKLTMWIRKSAHFVEYGILALLAFRAALISAHRSQITTPAWITLFLVAAVAAADEARQTFSPVRTGSPYDVLIDITGGVIALLGVLLIMRRMRSPGPAGTSAGTSAETSA